MAHLKSLEEFWVRRLWCLRASVSPHTYLVWSGELQQDPRSQSVGTPASRDHDAEDNLSRGQPVPDERRRWVSTEDYYRASASHSD
jgi:hypothetical protein